MGRLGRPSNDAEANRAFGRQPDGTFHHGTDWGWGQGDGVCAMADGLVTAVRFDKNYGWVVTVDHGNLIDGKHTETDYCHLDPITPQMIAVGAKPRRGTDIAKMGNTGAYAKGIKHLHSALRLNGIETDEQLYQKEIVMAPNSRVVGATNAKRRTTPTVPKPGEPDNLYPDLLTFNTPVLVTGYRTDLDPTHFIVSATCPAPGSNKFFLVDDAEDGGNVLWSHASTFTDPSTTGIPSLDPAAPAPGYPTAAEIAAAVDVKLAPRFKALETAIAQIPTAAQNAEATATEISERGRE